MAKVAKHRKPSRANDRHFTPVELERVLESNLVESLQPVVNFLRRIEAKLPTSILRTDRKPTAWEKAGNPKLFPVMTLAEAEEVLHWKRATIYRKLDANCNPAPGDESR